MSDKPWIRIEDEMPPEGLEVPTKIDDERGVRNEQPMTRRGRLWFITDYMYAYYNPTHWRLP